MAKYFVGQRVRVVGASSPFCRAAKLIGLEGIINEMDCSDGFAKGMVGVTVGGDPEWCFLPSQLEPITPPHVAGSWEEVEQLLPNIREGVAA